jgi:8-oxo-dGTP diphosphatase
MIDLAHRMAYRWAYRLLRIYWRAAHPRTHGALVALWWQGQVLLVQNSYVSFRSLPGGAVQRNESARAAAVRELREEVGIVIDGANLRPVVDEVHEWEGKLDHVEIFELVVQEQPTIRVDNREVVSAAFYAPERALQLPLFPLIRNAIAARVTRGD